MSNDAPRKKPSGSRTSAATTPTVAPPVTVLGLTRGDTIFTLALGTVILVLMAVHWLRLTARGAPPVEIDRLEAKSYEFQVDINHATWVEWMQLEGIGETLARRIVADVREHGPFSGIDDVNRVPGIGPKTLDQIRPFLMCSDCDPPPAPETRRE